MGTIGRSNSQCLIAGPLTIVRTHREMSQAATNFWALRSDRDLWEGRWCPEHLAVVAAGCVHYQGSESNNRLHLVDMPCSEAFSEITGPTGHACSQTPSGGRPCPLLKSEMAAGWFAPAACIPHKRWSTAHSLCKRCPATPDPTHA